MSAKKLNQSSVRQQTIGSFLKSWRETNGYTLAEVGKRLGTSRVYIFHVENDKFHLPIEFIKNFKKLLSQRECEVLDAIAVKVLLDQIR